MTPIREQILQALATRVGAIRALEGIDVDDLPLTVLVEGEDTPGEEQYDMTPLTLPVTIGRAVEMTGLKGDAWQTQANTLLADLIVEAYGTDETLGGLADGIDYAGGTPDVLTDGASGVMAQANFEIRYAIARGNPYSQEVI